MVAFGMIYGKYLVLILIKNEIKALVVDQVHNQVLNQVRAQIKDFE